LIPAIYFRMITIPSAAKGFWGGLHGVSLDFWQAAVAGRWRDPLRVRFGVSVAAKANQGAIQGRSFRRTDSSASNRGWFPLFWRFLKSFPLGIS
jgi:hypothetical protein